MADDVRDAITAIRDTTQEGFIAGALQRIGFNVVHRATSVDGLSSAVEKSPEAIIVASEDFLVSELSAQNKILTIASTSKTNASGKYVNPTSDFELQELLRAPEAEERLDQRRVPEIGCDVTVVSGIYSGIGVSTMALNIAQEFAQSGESTLLLEVNQPSPFLSEHLDIPHINRGIVPTSYGFSVGEISSLETLTRFSEGAQGFSRVVLDLGKLDPIEQILRGNRLEDISSTWALQSATRILLLTRSSSKSVRKIEITTRELRESVLGKVPMIGVILQSTLGRRERNLLTSQIRDVTKAHVAIFSRDFRAVSKADEVSSCLCSASPKSPLRSEILTHLISPILGSACER